MCKFDYFVEQDLNSTTNYLQVMELVNYQELKREAYLTAIKKLEEEYSNDEHVLRKLEQFKTKNPNLSF